ncbi:MAG: hypothetical protein J6Z36_02240 [Clostridia bacterium]|nr:hypothetical protein [Clostridia bacterium]
MSVNVFRDVKKFYKEFTGAKEIIGYSVLRRPVFAMRVGCSRPVGIVQGAIHAREWITTYLILEQIRLSVGCGSVWFLPLVNPDGVALATTGIESVAGEGRRKKLLKINGGGNFSLWKANANAVDLNVNFDARWGSGLSNVHAPAPENYVGEAPFSEPETKALKEFTLRIRPDYTISYHTMGKEIYWQFHQPFFRGAKDKKRACILSKLTGYPLKTAEGSVGGYKDWCIETLKIPAFTIEVGAGKHPLGFKALNDILCENLCAVREFSERWYTG